MNIILIASVSKNGFIGKNNKLMWHLPNDLIRFKHLTLGKPILMGRKTFDSIGKILPKRTNIVLTKKKNKFLYSIEKKEKNLKIILSFKEIKFFNYKELFVIGGEQVYNKMINKANKIELTLVHKYFNGDTKFPKINIQEWIKTKELFYKKDKNHLYDYSFISFKKRN